MRVLVTGGAGYIGSHTVIKLIEAGHCVEVVDNFSRSKRSVIPRLEQVTRTTIPVHEMDLLDLCGTEEVVSRVRPDAVMHFAGLKAVGESVEEPLKYYSINLGSTMSLVSAMQKFKVKKLVFSSSATVYGATERPPMREEFATASTNPYGRTKVMQEQMLTDIAHADGSLRIALLRYFNPVGAHPSGVIGEDPCGTPNNLMPLVAQVAAGQRREVLIYGDDYPTVDGTGCRDYIHVEDLAAGHVAALERLTGTDKPVSVWNLGTGRATSVKQVIAEFAAASERVIPCRVVGRRPGDVAESYADPSRAERDLQWAATHSLFDMCLDAWRWQMSGVYGKP